MVQRAGIVAAALLTALLSGCKVEEVKFLDHPSRCSPGETLSVALAHMLYIGDTDSILSSDERYDSMHIAIGLPLGWRVLSVSCYADTVFNVKNDLAAARRNHPGADPLMGALEDSLSAFRPRGAAMVGDTQIADFAAGASASIARGPTGDTATMDPASASQWKGFSARIGVLKRAGTRLDTMLDVQGLDFSAHFWSAVPAYVFLTMQAAGSGSQDTLVYFPYAGAPPDSSVEADPNVTAILGVYSNVAFHPVAIDAAKIAFDGNQGRKRRDLLAAVNRMDAAMALRGRRVFSASGRILGGGISGRGSGNHGPEDASRALTNSLPPGFYFLSPASGSPVRGAVAEMLRR